MEKFPVERPVHTEVLLRKQESNKGALKEKFVAIYEAFFQGLDPSKGNPQFWEEALLLKVNSQFLERCIILTSEEQLLAIKSSLNTIFVNCSAALRDRHVIRVGNALLTLTVLLKNIFRKKFTNFGVEVLNMITGSIDHADEPLKDFLRGIQTILQGFEDSLKPLALTLLLIIATATDNINQNTLIEYFMAVDLFDTLLALLVDPKTRELVGIDAVFLLCILINYRKYESQSNLYMQKISEIKSQEVWELLSSTFTPVVSRFNRDHVIGPVASKGYLQRLSDYVSFFSYPQDPANPTNSSDLIGPFLLGLYEFNYLTKGAFFGLPSQKSKAGAESPEPLPKIDNKQLELIPQLFTYCSYLFSDIKDMRSALYSRLCLIIFICMVEDNAMCSLFHDPLYSQEYSIYVKAKKTIATQKKLPVCALLEILISFMRANLKKKTQVDLYSKCLAIIIRILSFEKKTNTPLEFKWLDLWEALFQVLKFFSTDDSYQNPEMLALSSQAAKILNLFITYGETLLSSSQYDELYYEILRNRKMLDHFYNIVDQVDSEGRLVGDWANIRQIVIHFGTEVDHWCDAHPSTAISEDQVRNIIRGNYDTLRLKLQDNLVAYDAYLENPKEATFFRQLLRLLVFDYKSTVQIHSPR